MTAIALMFAVLKTKPTPFCILDEVEAALDDANIDRFSRYLRKFDNIQFALVTHQKATMEHADVLLRRYDAGTGRFQGTESASGRRF